jgi:hypothetical protein
LPVPVQHHADDERQHENTDPRVVTEEDRVESSAEPGYVDRLSNLLRAGEPGHRSHV